MMQENVARSVEGSEERGGLQLVYSRDWSPARRQNALTRMQPDRRMQPTRPPAKKTREAKSDRGNVVRLWLGAAAVSGPLVWAVFALLHWARVL